MTSGSASDDKTSGDSFLERFYQFLLIASFIPFSWLTFMVVHEFGHVVTAWLSGGAVARVVLHPMQISWTALARNPHPQLVAWGGPALGALLPFGVSAGVSAMRLPGAFQFRFFSGFCLVANGLYLLVDAFEKGGDGGTLLRNGASRWQLLLFAAVTTPLGFYLWQGLGKHFGLGTSRGRVSHSAAVISAVLLALVITLELALY